MELGGTSSDDGDYEERLDDSAGCYGPTYFDDPKASSSGVGMDLSEVIGSLLNFLRDRRRVIMEGCFRLDLSIDTEIAFRDRFPWSIRA